MFVYSLGVISPVQSTEDGLGSKLDPPACKA